MLELGPRELLTLGTVLTGLAATYGVIKTTIKSLSGQIEEIKELDLDVVVVVRLQGTNAKLAKKILDESDIELISAETINEAATKAGIPVQGHAGLVPRRSTWTGGLKAVGKNLDEAIYFEHRTKKTSKAAYAVRM